MHNKTIIPLGVGRSGTSIVAGLLHHMGVFMGDNFIPTDDFNKHGYFEDRSIMLTQSEVLHSINRSWWNPPLSEAELPGYDIECVGRLRQLINNRCLHPGLSGWKDPRTKFLLPLYKDLLINPHFIIVFRDVLATARSIMKRDALDEVAAYYVIKTHTNKLYDFIFDRSYPTLIMSFNDFFNRPEYEIERIARFIEISNYNINLVDFIDHKERHF